MTHRPSDDDATQVESAGDEFERNEAARELSRVGPYRLISLLGRGGMGAVYLAEQLEPVRRKVALKLVRQQTGKGVAGALFEVERQMLAQMRHPYIAQVYDAGTTGEGRPWFAMEWVPGKPIDAFCQHRELERVERVRLFMRVCQGVQHAHHRGIIHRDLKPANVLVSEIDGEYLPKIIDFGVATSVIDEEGGSRNISSDRAGTIGYMSPEQNAEDGMAIDTRTDVFSLGVMLFELLTRHRPPAGRDSETLESFCQSLSSPGRSRPAGGNPTAQPVEEALASASSLDYELRWILARALAPDRDDRYESAAALARDLECFLNGDVVRAVPPTRRYHWRKFLWKHRVPVTAGSLVGVSLVIGLAVSLWLLIQVQYERDRAQEQAERAEQTSGFVTRMLGSINPDYADGADTALMRRVLDDAAERATSELADRPAILAEIEHTIGRAYFLIGEHDTSGSHFQTARELTASDPDLRNLHVDVLRHIAELHGRRGDFEEGLAKIDGLLASIEGELPADHPQVLDSQAIRAYLLQMLGDYEAAEEQAMQVIASSAGDESSDMRNIHYETMRTLAQIHSDQMNFDQAHEVYEALLQSVEDWDDPAARRHRLAALSDHAVVYLREQQYAEAEPLLREAIEAQRELYGEGHPLTSQAINNLGGSLRQQGRPEEALPHYQYSLELFREHFGQEHPQTIFATYNLGNCHRDLGQYEEAVELHRQALALGEEHLSQNRHVQGMLRLGLGRSELARENAEAAKQLLLEAHEMLLDTAGESYHRTIEAAEYLDKARAALGS
ncbi:serine/threonine protein kinase [Wenzhouxiangella sp. AB-CW3]|uniref:tetratricopeptide repeat-containing serine/threonine-protein kinase n=1 Tax=Wenzhouxiangella sp. AB-CW3 TaxID=2771012 RepID=UPI00168AC9B4|nr:tetratricopeptide repeat-containing serine/threonine-protein kinase [Wenzhouxiangella sp. AB-CW3]QOC23287.1 serine/threonine protein kinase [Wenzhouxiangella sp. AB-CW3]